MLIIRVWLVPRWWCLFTVSHLRYSLLLQIYAHCSEWHQLAMLYDVVWTFSLDLSFMLCFTVQCCSVRTC